MSAPILHVAKVAGISGSENHLLLLLPSLRARGHDVRFAMLHEGEPGAAEMADRLRAADVPVEEVRLPLPADPRALLRLVRIARRVRPAILHTHLVHADFLGLTAATVAGVPVRASTKHGFNAFRDNRAFGLADRGIARLTDLHIAISAGLAQYLAEREGLDRNRFEIVHYGIEPGPPPVPPPGSPRLAIVGRLIPIKGHAVLFDAVASARRTIPELTLEVAGDGALEAELRAVVTRLGLDDAVRFLGRVAEPGPVFERAEIVVVSSFGEGFGMVALEAMERGRAVIASAVGGLPEIVEDGATGILVQPGDPRALADAIVRLADDPERTAAMGAAGRERALAAFAQERCTTRVEELYGEALAAAGVRRSPTWRHSRSSANAASSASRKSQGTR